MYRVPTGSGNGRRNVRTTQQKKKRFSNFSCRSFVLPRKKPIPYKCNKLLLESKEEQDVVMRQRKHCVIKRNSWSHFECRFRHVETSRPNIGCEGAVAVDRSVYVVCLHRLMSYAVAPNIPFASVDTISKKDICTHFHFDSYWFMQLRLANRCCHVNDEVPYKMV